MRTAFGEYWTLLGPLHFLRIGNLELYVRKLSNGKAHLLACSSFILLKPATVRVQRFDVDGWRLKA